MTRPRVMVWPADTSGCGHYRLILPAETLQAQAAADVTVDFAGPKVLWDRDWSGEITAPLDAHVVGLAEIPDADVIVIQRPGRAHWTETIPHLHAAGIRVVIDIDDDFNAIPAGNAAYFEYDERKSPRMNRQWIARAAELADVVTVSTRALASRYGARGRKPVVLPNMVPAAYLEMKPPAHLERPSIGWSGSVATHPGDLQTVGTAVADVLGAHPDWGFHAVGTGAGVGPALGLADLTSTGGWLPFRQYPSALSMLDVGVVPLRANRFNEAKSALKLAECSALGVATVASATTDNRRLYAHGVGLLAETPAQWRQHLEHLVSEPEFRAEVAGRSREAMAAHTYEQWADLWADAWESAVSAKKAVA